MGRCPHVCCDPTAPSPPRASSEMLRLRSVVQHLQHRRTQIAHHVCDKRSLLAPIRRLPPEILQMVFHAVLTVTASTEQKFKYKYTPAIWLTHICYYWRTVVFDTSTLWTSVFLSQQSKWNISRLKSYSLHAKSLPLSVICLWPSSQLLQKLAELSHRWRHLMLWTSKDLFSALGPLRNKIPLLQNLHLSLDYDGVSQILIDMFENAPSLRGVHLNFTGEDGITGLSRIILPWTQVLFHAFFLQPT